MKENPHLRIVFPTICDGAAKRARRRKLPVALTFLICLSVTLSACSSSTGGMSPGPGGFTGVTCPGPDTGSSSILENIIFNGVEFKSQIAEANGLLPTNTFWFSARDDKTVRFGWNESLIQTHDPSAPSCNHPRPSEGCRQCNYCSDSCNDGTTPNFTFSDVISFGQLSEINEQGDPLLVRPISNPQDGCFLRNGNTHIPSFVPTKDTNYVLRLGDFCGNTVSMNKFSAKVVNMKRQIQLTLVPYVNDINPALRFLWQMPQIDGRLAENFSPNLKVTKVRVLLGNTDPATGLQNMPPKQDSLTLRKWRPSRILFLPDFRMGNINDAPTERINRCYLDADKDDGDFNLLNCRSGPPTPRVFDTPARNITPTYMHGRNNETLTWVVEYKMESGLTEVPALGANEFLILELTIEGDQ